MVPWNIYFYYRKKGKFKIHSRLKNEQQSMVIQEVCLAIVNLQKKHRGATIILDLYNDVAPHIVDSQLLDAKMSANLIVNIFEGHNTPLHDGAVIIADGRIKFASAYITKISTKNIVSSKMGTRHRSALGLSEYSEAIIIVLSEETGSITVFRNGAAKIVDAKELPTYLTNEWLRQND